MSRSAKLCSTSAMLPYACCLLRDFAPSPLSCADLPGLAAHHGYCGPSVLSCLPNAFPSRVNYYRRKLT